MTARQRPILLRASAIATALLAVAGSAWLAAAPPRDEAVQARTAPAAPAPGDSADDVARGKYLVTIAGCNDCHTPMKMGERGPEPDMSRMLSGHPAGQSITAPVALSAPWSFAGSTTGTAWSGPWGVSFTANLTPDPETGLGKWTARDFQGSLRTGRHMGRGRPILPPMPWPMYRQMTDADIAAMFAYLQTIPAIDNKVPEPLPPPAAAAVGG